MPDTVLPASIQSEISDILRRLTALESFPPAGMTVISTKNISGESGAFYANANTDYYVAGPHSYSAPFTLLRPTTILLVGHMTGIYSGAGTANYIYWRMAIVANVSQVQGSNDIYGNQMEGPFFVQTAGAATANSTSVTPFVVPAGTWQGVWGYQMNAGATTTFNYSYATISIYSLAG